MIEICGRFCQRLGVPRSTGQIYGLLFLAISPLSLDDIVEQLGISKASASMGTRQLKFWGAIRQVWVPGTRRDHFEVVADLVEFLRSAYRNNIKSRMAASEQILSGLVSSLDTEFEAGILSLEERELFLKRLQSLQQLQSKLMLLAPLAEKML